MELSAAASRHELSTKICRHISVDNSACTNAALLAKLEGLAAAERQSLPELLACLSAVEERGLHLDQGYSDMFEYCVGRLRWGEGAAMQRLTVARAASLYPEIYSYLRDGQLNLSAVSRLSAHLTPENRTAILTRAGGLRRGELDKMLCELRTARTPTPSLESPVPETTDVSLPFVASEPPPVAIRRSESVNVSAPEAPRLTASPVAIETEQRMRMTFLADARVRGEIDRSRQLLKTTCPSGALEELIAYLVHDFLRRRDPDRRRSATVRPSRDRQTRVVPQWVKDRVWKRDGGRCAYISSDGRRCESRRRLEYDHIRPWAKGGSSDDPENVRLLCRSHNRHVARRHFGERV